MLEFTGQTSYARPNALDHAAEVIVASSRVRAGWAILIAVAAGQLASVRAASGQGRRERLDMPYKAPACPLRFSSPPPFDPTDHLQRQVNVNAQGMNILGDAANEPSIAVDPTAPNRIAIGWRQFDTVTSNFRQAGHASSRDGGRTWINGGVLTPGVFRSDPVLRADSSGSIYFCSLDANFVTSIFRSTDGGATFGPPAYAFGGDKEWLAIDRTGLATDGNQYQHWGWPFARSFDHGATWSQSLVTTPQWGNSAVGPDGTLYIAGQATTVARSTNVGNPSVTPLFTSALVNFGGQGLYGAAPNPGGLAGQGNVDVDRSTGPRRGWVYALCSVSNAANSCDVVITRSADGGQTWLANPIKVNNDPLSANSWHWFGTMSVSPNGRIDVIWNDTRESQNPLISRLYYACSEDGGDTWMGNTPLGPAWNSTVGYPMQNKIGDYYDMQSDNVGAFLAYSATYNAGQDVYFLRINDWDCNNNGIADSTDLANGTLHDCNANGIPDECEIAAGVAVPCVCYANCDWSTTVPVLNANDFQCFMNKFAARDGYANCDGSTSPPVLNANDFQCFLNRFAVGCP